MKPQLGDGVAPVSRPSRRWVSMVYRGCFLGLILAIIIEALRVLVGNNFHVVVPGKFYRCAQLPADQLERLVQTHKIRTVVNLRGCSYPFEWYTSECRATRHQDVSLEDICFSAGRLPSVHEIHRLVEVLDSSEYPLLFHCRHGADRTGMAMAVAMLLHTDASLGEGRRQLSMRYGHVPLGRPTNLDRFLELYSEWLDQKGLEHSRIFFRSWLENYYCPGECCCRVEPLDFPSAIPRDHPVALRMRFHNISVKRWRLQPGSNAGIHAIFRICNDEGRCVAQGQAGLLDAEVLPGQSIDLSLPLPALRSPGRYRLLVDMSDEQHCCFYQTGSEPFEGELQVREQETAIGGQCGSAGMVGMAHRLASDR